MLARRLLRREFSVNPLKTVIRSESQNITWSHADFEKHSDAFSTGIQELGFKKGDKIVTWFDKAHVVESVVTQIGSLKAGITLVPVTTLSSASFFSAVSEPGVRGAIFSPNGRVDNNIKKQEVLLNNISELQHSYKGSSVKSHAFPKLDFLIQTGFYTIPGTFKFRDVLTYANPNFLNFNLNEIDESQTLYSWNGAVTLGQISDSAASFGYSNPKSTIVTLGNINNPQLFAKSGLTSFTNGNLSVFIPNEDDAISVLRNVSNPVIVHDSTVQKVTLDAIKSLGISNFVAV